MPSSEEISPARPGTPTAVAYFTMEVALDQRLPTYSGGLGVLAGDFLRSAADLSLPLVAVTLAYRNGYFDQRLDEDGNQSELPVSWDPSELLERLDTTVEVEISGRQVQIGAWKLSLAGISGATVDVLFLDSDVPGNEGADREITDQLYGGDLEHRARQEALLGLGGCAMLGALGYDELQKYHMNEGHAAFLTLAVLDGRTAADSVPSSDDIEAVRGRCVFTTHTPVPAGHDRFPADLVGEVIGERYRGRLEQLGLLEGGELNMTELGTKLSGYVNAVSRRHAEVTRRMLPGVEVSSITNGVHHVRWTAEPMQALFDDHLPGWRDDSALLRYAGDLPLPDLAEAHDRSKRALIETVLGRTGVSLHESALTIGLARRVTPYKRTLLLFSDPDRLVALAERHGPIQVLCSGKAHPRDADGKAAIRALVAAGRKLGGAVDVVFLDNYDLALAAALCAGCDLWLNTPQRPLEASGTSGMKAALNGVPSLSVLDGWWIEGCVEGVTGWAIGADADETATPEELAVLDSAALYEQLDGVVAPAFFGGGDDYLRVRRSAIALNGSFFTTDRMTGEYARAAYGLVPEFVAKADR